MSPNPSATRTNISYQEVCQGRSGYVEVLLVELRDPQSHFEELVRYFFSIHDPTTLNRQGSDRGSQYQSIIFCADEHQVEIATRVKEELQQLLNRGAVRCFERKRVRTRIVNMSYFIEATERHQNYLNKNPNGYW
jgi:peptide-methionine (S)-S-oxide reductase